MTDLLLRLLLALAAEALCERIRPTERYVIGGYFRVGDGPWRYREAGVGLRRPWQAYPAMREPVTLPLGAGTSVTLQGPAVYPIGGRR